MKFEEALIKWKKNKLIRRNIWDKECYLASFERMDGLSINMNDLFAEDWDVVESPVKSFPEVFEAFKEGKNIKRKNWGNDYINRYRGGPIDMYDILEKDWEVVE